VNFKRMLLLDRAPDSKRDKRAAVRHLYYFDTTLLQRIQRELTPYQEEEGMLVTGVRFADPEGAVVSVPTSGFVPDYKEHSITGIEADPESVRAILSCIESNGQVVLARCHSHPGSGLGMAQASQRDIGDQKHWEKLGYETVSGIFTRSINGAFFVRFICIDMQVIVRVIGNAKHRGRHVWEIPDEASV
jgi:hypothetical protein